MGFRDDDEMLQMRAEALEREIAAVREAIAEMRARVGENVEAVRKQVHGEQLDRLRAEIRSATSELARVERSWPLDRRADDDDDGSGCAAAAGFYALVGVEIVIALAAAVR